MSKQGIISGVLVLSCIFSLNVSAADVPKKITCSGKVVDDANRPVAGVKVARRALQRRRRASGHGAQERSLQVFVLPPVGEYGYRLCSMSIRWKRPIRCCN